MFALNQTTSTTHTFGSAVQTGAVDLFRLTFPIVLPVDAVTQEIVFDTGSCGFNARFLTLETGTPPQTTIHYPTNPMLGIAPQSAPGDAFYFFSATGELGASKGEDHPAGALLNSGIANDKQAFVKALANVANRLLEEASSPPAQLTLLLVAESNARCRLRIDTLKVAYRRAFLARLNGSQEKQTLTFDATRTSTQTLQLQKPPGSSTISAVLELSAKPAGAASLQVLPGGNGSGGDPLEPGPALTQKYGLRVDPGMGGAQAFTLSGAQSVRGVALALLPLAGKATLSLTLEADKEGRPGGAPLATAELEAGAPGQPGWYTAVFRRPPLIPTAPHWLVLRSGQGAVVWLGDSPAPTDLAAEGDGKYPALRISPSANALLYRWLSSASGAAAGGAQPGDLSPPGNTVQALRLQLGGQLLPLLGVENQGQQYNLQPALNALAAGSSTSLPLSITGFNTELVTVYPPRIVYDA